MQRKWLLTGVHIVFWMSMTFFLISTYSIQSYEIENINGKETIEIVRSKDLVLQLFLCLGLSSGLFYYTIYLLSRLRSPKGLLSVIVLSILSLGCVLLVVMGMDLIPGLNTVYVLPRQVSFGIVGFFYSIAIAVGVGKLFLYNQGRQEILVLEKTKAEINLLRNQLQPHFLFNALNNLMSMVDQSNNPLLANSIERLSLLLRYVVDETKKDKVTIRKEIDFIKNYNNLQLLRFAESEVDIQFLIKGNHYDQEVEPGLFINFVENAFTYGTQPEQQSCIQMSFDLREANRIIFWIKNKIWIHKVKDNSNGIDSIKKRLDFVYPERHSLSITQGDDFEVKLNIITS